MSNVFILKSKGPSMDPWGTPNFIFDHVLKDEFILILCLRSNKYLLTKFKESLWKPYAWSFSVNKSCIIQSNANRAP